MKKLLLSLFLLGMTLIPNVVSAAVETIEADGEYHLGDYENVSVGRERAKEDALRNASMKGGTFIRSEMKSVDNILTENQVVLVTSNIVRLQDLEIKNDITSDKESIVIRCHVIVLVDSENFEKIINNPERLKTILNNTKMVEDERDRLQKDADYWRNKYETAVNDSEREKAVQEIENNENVFTATQYFDRGNKLIYAGNYSEAVDEYSKAIELNPNYALAYLNRGAAYQDLKQYSYAIRDYTRAIEINPVDADAYYNRGSVYDEMGQYSEAIQDLDKAVKLNPNHKEAYYNRGVAYYYLSRYVNAILEYSRAIELDEKYTLAYYSRGVSYYNLGKYNQALADFQRVIELDPSNQKAKNYANDILQNRK